MKITRGIIELLTPLSNTYLLSSKQDNEITNIINSTSMQSTLNSFHVMSYHFSIEQILYVLFHFFFFFFAFVTSLLSILIKKYIFDFNPTNPLIIFPLNSSFNLPITFLLTGSKNFESNG